MDVYIAADMHLKPSVNRAQNNRLKDFLSLVKSNNASLILAGDTFNCWFENYGKCAGDYGEVLELFSEYTSNGLQIDLISGNRDFAFSAPNDPKTDYKGYSLLFNNETSLLSKAGVTLRGFEYTTTIDNCIYHFAHGDKYCTKIVWHQLLRYLIMGNPTRFLASFVHPSIVGLVFKLLKVYDRVATANNHEIHADRLMQDEVVQPLIEQGVDHVVCGHIHKYITRKVLTQERDGVLTVLPCWCSGEYGIIRNNGIQIKKHSNS